MREMFNESQLISELEKIGNNLKKRIKVFLLGGCSMVLRGYKLATKDIDVVFTSPSDLRDFIDVLKGLGFQEIVKLPKEYEVLGASAVLRDAKGSQFDLFHRQVCRGLEITKRVEEQSNAERLEDWMVHPTSYYCILRAQISS